MHSNISNSVSLDKSWHCFIQDDPNGEKYGMETLYIFYGVFCVIYASLAVALLLLSLKKIKELFYNEIIDIYKLIQYCILMFYLIIGVCHLTLKFYKGYEFHNYGVFLFIYFHFLMSEVINISCWRNFQSHLCNCVNGLKVICRREEETDSLSQFSETIFSGFRTVKIKEKFEIFVIFIVFFLFCIWNMFIIIFSVANSHCSGCHSLYAPADEVCFEATCKNISIMRKKTFYVLCVFAGVVILFKLFFGVRLLILMRHHLYVRYLKSRKGIIFTLISSCIIIASRTLLTFVNNVAKCDLRYNFTARMPFPSENGLLQLLIALIKDLLPIAVMLLNIRTINFKVYLIELIKACKLHSFSEEASIFLYHSGKTSHSNLVANDVYLTDVTDSTTRRRLIDVADQSDETSLANEDQYKSNYEQISRIDRYQSAMMTTRSMGPHLENSL
ncbi:unnamed protein product [Moneuplotes crassus]|uniref:Uncharacterized protein n=1 Tax=Euplotes crassus TaxID=5936 RepID=A0AAD1XD79_EUPCR|nr:unnamed protein product [Moneuplotes crassus]